MNVFITISPAIFLLLLVTLLIVTIFQFDHLRWTYAKDFLNRIWSADRRRILHLDKQNGFYYHVDRLIMFLEKTTQYPWVFALPALLGGRKATIIAGLIISSAYLLRFGGLSLFATGKVKHFTLPPSYDGYGVYARSAADWKAFRNRQRHPFNVSLGCILLFIFILYDETS